MNLTGGIPLVKWVDCLGMVGITTGSLLIMDGLLAPVELTGMFPITGGVALLVKVGGTRWSIGKAKISGAERFELKGW